MAPEEAKSDRFAIQIGIKTTIGSSSTCPPHGEPVMHENRHLALEILHGYSPSEAGDTVSGHAILYTPSHTRSPWVM